MATKSVTPMDIFQSLTAAEKRKVLAMLRKSEQTPCELKGHQYRPVRVISKGLFSPPVTQMVCTRCGDSFTC